MAVETTAGQPHPRAGRWAVHAAVTAAVLERRLAQSTAAEELDARQSVAKRAVEDMIKTARDAVSRRRGLRDWWRGTAVERAYQNLHAARVILVELLPDHEVAALIPEVVARATSVLPRDDPRRLQVDQLPEMPPGPARTAAVQRVMDLGYHESDELHVRLREFRNVMLTAALLILLLTVVLVGIVSLNPSVLPLCFHPSATAPGAADPAAGQLAQVCPSGHRTRPAAGDVLMVAGVGLLGGALAAAFAIRKIRGQSTPYHLPVPLALFKASTGALTAILGILLLGGGFVPGLSELDSQPQILAYALLFGYAQQVATRLIDNRAAAIVDDLPDKGPGGKPPEPAQ